MDIRKICSEMTIEQKIDLVTGSGFWHTKASHDLPALRFADGPHGLRVAGESALSEGLPATCFPALSALAASWDKYLVGETAAAIAEEATAAGVHVVFGPGVNIKRNPLCGRNFEYLSEDPYLAGELGAFYVSGLQARGVGACVKHFALGSQETLRMTASSECDERTVREIYLAAFERVVREANPAAVMTAYNKIGGAYCSENGRLINGILREEWGFGGVVVSDRGGIRDRVAALKAGCDLQMPESDGGRDRLRAALNGGELTEAELDESVMRLIGLIDATYLEPSGTPNFSEHNKLAYRGALGSMTLLKNDGALPLKRGSLVALCGRQAFEPRIQGSGSSRVTPAVTPVSAAEGFARREFPVSLARGTELHQILRGTVGAECAVVFVGPEDETEGLDRTDMRLSEEDDLLVEALVSAGGKVVVVVTSGAPVEMPWADRVSAILLAGCAGQMSGQAAADILIGRVSPCGRLAESWPVSYGDCPSRIESGGPVEYREGIFVGYRYYDAANVRVRFPFGHGLSYGKFVYSDLVVKKIGEADFTVTVTVENVSQTDAAEVVQLYVTDKSGVVCRPPRELAGFEKVQVKAGDRAVVTMTLGRRSFAFYDAEAGRFEVGRGEYVLSVGASSRDIRLSQTVWLDGTEVRRRAPAWYERPEGLPPREDFVSLLGRDPQPPAPPKKGRCSERNTVAELARCSGVARMSAKRADKAALKASGGIRDMRYETVKTAALNTPLDALPDLSGGAMTRRQAEGLVDAANGKLIRGITKLIFKERKR